MLARFFIERPIFAWVLSIVILLAGGVSVVTLPTAQYPDITPPTVQVTASYPGASAQVVADAVADAFRAHGAQRMIHGHTHRPARHVHDVDGAERERYVLADWHEHGQYLAVDANGVRDLTIHG